MSLLLSVAARQLLHPRLLLRSRTVPLRQLLRRSLGPPGLLRLVPRQRLVAYRQLLGQPVPVHRRLLPGSGALLLLLPVRPPLAVRELVGGGLHVRGRELRVSWELLVLSRLQLVASWKQVDRRLLLSCRLRRESDGVQQAGHVPSRPVRTDRRGAASERHSRSLMLGYLRVQQPGVSRRGSALPPSARLVCSSSFLGCHCLPDCRHQQRRRSLLQPRHRSSLLPQWLAWHL
mmetsp:Transcript_39771/g.124935  ORF Transcript_39771/g.124935 Transcript_39771/m.124935 type:complete len:232 (-) Transcript_39771:1518-2213(-)